MLPVVEGLLPEPRNGQLLTLFFRLAEWHALAKLRVHTEHTLDYLDQATVAIGRGLRAFRDWTQELGTVELPGEASARQRRKSKKVSSKKTSNHAAASCAVPSQNQLTSLSKRVTGSKACGATVDPPAASGSNRPPPKAKGKHFNLLTYKMHALGDYVRTIKLFGTTDSYSTQVVRFQAFLSVTTT